MASPFRHRGARMIYEHHHGPNMTPMVDVVMVILIFFMASASLLGPELMQRTGLAPDATTGNAERDQTPTFSIEPPSFVVRLYMDEGVVLVEGMGISGRYIGDLDNAATRLAQQLGGAVGSTNETALDTPIVIEPTGDVPYEAIMRAQDACLRAGFDRVGVR